MAESLETLADLPFHVAGRYPKGSLVRRCGAKDAGFKTQSSREFFEHIRDLSLGLGALGVEPGDRVAILAESRPEWLVADFAALTRGAVSVPIYPTLPVAQVRYILADSGSRVVIASDEEQAAKVRQVWSELPGLAALVVMEPAEPAPPAIEPGREELSLEVATARGHQRLMREDGLGRLYKEAAAAITPDTLATIIYTSGTTGRPKGIPLTHGNLYRNAVDLMQTWGFSKSDVLLHVLPIYHVHGLFVVLGPALLAGMRVRFLSRFDAETVAEALPGATVMAGVPTYYSRLLHSTSFSRDTCDGVRVFISGSAPLSEETFRRFHERTGHTILERYGCSIELTKYHHRITQ